MNSEFRFYVKLFSRRFGHDYQLLVHLTRQELSIDHLAMKKAKLAVCECDGGRTILRWFGHRSRIGNPLEKIFMEDRVMFPFDLRKRVSELFRRWLAGASNASTKANFIELFDWISELTLSDPAARRDLSPR